MIDTIIFDLGRVLLKFDWESHLKRLGASAEAITALRAGMFEHADWAEVDRGVLTKEEALHRFLERLPEYSELVTAVYNTLYDTVEPYDYAMQWVKALKEKGYRVLYLSNYGEWSYEQSKKHMDFMKYMDGGLFSYELKLLKPQKYIYAELAERFQLEPKNCVFLDDSQKNVEGARQYGMNAIWFQNYEQAEKELQEMI